MVNPILRNARVVRFFFPIFASNLKERKCSTKASFELKSTIWQCYN